MSYVERVRLIVYTTVFGVLWGILEMMLGSYLHMIQFPFRGAFMAGIGSVILCTERIYTDKPGATLSTGIVAVFFKLMSLGAFKLGPAAGILIESALAEMVLTLLGCGKMQFLLACLLACLEGIPHFFVTNWIFYGRGIFHTYLEAVRQMQFFFGIRSDFWKLAVGAWIFGHVLLGIASGILAGFILRQVKRAD